MYANSMDHKRLLVVSAKELCRVLSMACAARWRQRARAEAACRYGADARRRLLLA